MAPPSIAGHDPRRVQMQGLQLHKTGQPSKSPTLPRDLHSVSLSSPKPFIAVLDAVIVVVRFGIDRDPSAVRRTLVWCIKAERGGRPLTHGKLFSAATARHPSSFLSRPSHAHLSNSRQSALSGGFDAGTVRGLARAPPTHSSQPRRGYPSQIWCADASLSSAAAGTVRLHAMPVGSSFSRFTSTVQPRPWSPAAPMPPLPCRHRAATA